MTEFQKRVSEEVKKAETKYGHPITLSARVPTTPEEAFNWGDDAVEWANKGYVDRIVPSPFFSTADFEIPIAFWRCIIPESVKIDVGIELLLHTIGKLETAAKLSRRHIVTYHDLYSCGSQTSTVLPLICRHDSRCGKYLRMDIGPAPEKHRKTELIIGTDSECPPHLVPYLNGTPLKLRKICTNMKTEKDADVISEYKSFEKIPLSSRNLLVYDVDASILKTTEIQSDFITRMKKFVKSPGVNSI